MTFLPVTRNGIISHKLTLLRQEYVYRHFVLVVHETSVVLLLERVKEGLIRWVGISIMLAAPALQNLMEQHLILINIVIGAIGQILQTVWISRAAVHGTNQLHVLTSNSLHLQAPNPLSTATATATFSTPTTYTALFSILLIHNAII